MHFVTFLPLAHCTSVVHGVMQAVNSVTTFCYMSVISSYTVRLWYMVPSVYSYKVLLQVQHQLLCTPMAPYTFLTSVATSYPSLLRFCYQLVYHTESFFLFYFFLRRRRRKK